jgi:hypothetical protein
MAPLGRAHDGSLRKINVYAGLWIVVCSQCASRKLKKEAEMDLKDFVSQSLIQIVQGVRDAAGPIAEMGGYVSPAHSSKTDGHVTGHTLDGKGRVVHSVHFDVAIVAENDAKVSGGGGLKVMGVRLGADASAGEREQTSSRIQFVVPLALPIDQVSQDEADKHKADNLRSINRALNR